MPIRTASGSMSRSLVTASTIFSADRTHRSASSCGGWPSEVIRRPSPTPEQDDRHTLNAGAGLMKISFRSRSSSGSSAGTAGRTHEIAEHHGELLPPLARPSVQSPPKTRPLCAPWSPVAFERSRRAYGEAPSTPRPRRISSGCRRRGRPAPGQGGRADLSPWTA